MEIAIVFILFLFVVMVAEGRRNKYWNEYLKRNKNLRMMRKRVRNSNAKK